MFNDKSDKKVIYVNRLEEWLKIQVADTNLSEEQRKAYSRTLAAYTKIKNKESPYSELE